MTTHEIMLAIVFFTALTLQPHLSHAQNSPQDLVDAHNAARKEVGVGPIAWNDTVAAYALNYANKMKASCELEHSGGPYGENLAEGYGNFSGVDAVTFWLTEKANYDYDSNAYVGGGDECLHYTQIVWRDSVHLGCARVQCDNEWWVIICSYDPPGNFEGSRPY